MEKTWATKENIGRFERLGDALPFCHLLCQPVEHFLCLPVDLGNVCVKDTVQKYYGAEDRAQMFFQEALMPLSL